MLPLPAPLGAIHEAARMAAEPAAVGQQTGDAAAEAPRRARVVHQGKGMLHLSFTFGSEAERPQTEQAVHKMTGDEAIAA